MMIRLKRSPQPQQRQLLQRPDRRQRRRRVVFVEFERPVVVATTEQSLLNPPGRRLPRRLPVCQLSHLLQRRPVSKRRPLDPTTFTPRGISLIIH